MEGFSEMGSRVMLHVSSVFKGFAKNTLKFLLFMDIRIFETMEL
jgi:hypothetical protein